MNGFNIVVSPNGFAVGTFKLAIRTYIPEMKVQVTTYHIRDFFCGARTLIWAAKESVPTCCEMVVQGSQLPHPATPILTVAAHDLE